MSDELENAAVEETVLDEVLDSTEGGEAQASEPSDESGEASESSPAPSGRARDEQGRFAKAVSQDEGTPVEGEGLDQPVDQALTEQAAKPETQYRPVSLKVDGQLFELPGAGQREDGIIELQPDAFEQVHRWMGKGMVADRKVQHLQSQLQALSEQKSAREQEVEAIGEMYAQMAMLDDEQLLGALQDFRQQLPVLQERIRREAVERELAQMRNANRPDPVQEQQALVQGFWTSFNEEWEGVLQAPWAKGLTPDDHAQLRAELEEVADSFLYRADRDDPEREIRRGEYLFNDVKFQKAVEKKAKYLATLRQTQTQVQAAKVQNAKQPQKAVGTPQGAPKVATPSQKAPASAPKPKSREEWLRQNMGL